MYFWERQLIVPKFVGRKEADRVGSWRLRYVYLRQINSHRCALCVTRKHQLSRSSPRSLSVFVPTVSLWQLVRSSLHSVSLWTAVPRRLLSGLHANYYNQTQVILILHLTHLLTAVSWVFLPLQTSLNHAPLATYPHRPTQAGKPSGLQPHPPHSWRGSRLQSSASPACGSPWIWRAVMPDTNGWSARWYPSCGGATARGRGPNRGWIPVPGDNSGGWGPPTGSPNTPSQWCCTSSLS